MKVVQVPFGFFPDPPGGTEVYVDALCRALEPLGTRCVVAAPAAVESAYEHRGLSVRRYASGPAPALEALYSAENPFAVKSFSKILDEEKPDVLHLHASTRDVSSALLVEARKRGIATVFTYHTPTVTCQRGTLMRWGRVRCDGKMRPAACAACSLQKRGLPKAVAVMASLVPAAAGRALGNAKLSGGPWTALRMHDLTGRRIGASASFLAEAGTVVAVCGWVKEILLTNGVPAEKIVLSRQGLAGALPPRPAVRPQAGPLKAAFFGRLDPDKGLHVLLRALREKAADGISLDVYAVRQSVSASYEKTLRSLVSDRVVFKEPIPQERVAEALSEYGALAVPSQWMESGPLVVLEAFAAGVPVAGSDLGGISETVRDGRDGILVSPHDSPAAWAEALGRLQDPEFRSRLASGIRAPRTMAEAAADMNALYARIAGDAR